VTEAAGCGPHLMVVFTECVEGEDGAFNEWYTGTHVPDVLALDGFVAVTRFRQAADPAGAPGRRYLAIWEIEGDLDAARRALVEGPARAKSNAYDPTKTVVEFYTPITVRIT